jgi:UDP-N-acetylglucosamine 2-epimerase (non-hydrolysing)
MLLVCFGTRPEYIKIKPLIEQFKGVIPYKLLFTGQHIDLLQNFDDIKKLNIIDGPNRLDSIVNSILNNEKIFENVSSVLIQGDTTSAFSIALAAFHRKIKIIHLEAGLRTYNRFHPYPEEFNRRSISAMADIHLCPTQLTFDNLHKEGITDGVYLVGNTVLDNLINISPTYDDKVLVTLHRRENHDIMEQWFDKIDSIAKKYSNLEFILPIHPNPNVQKHKHLLKYVKVVEPMKYDECIEYLAKCKLVITDSGGIQEESSFFKKKCIVCREHTERSEGVGTFSTLVNPNNIEKIFDKLIKDYIIDIQCPYGDGKSSQRILNILRVK